MSSNFRTDERPSASEKRGGRKKASSAQPELVPNLKKLVEHHTAGSPSSRGESGRVALVRRFRRTWPSSDSRFLPNTVDRLLRNELGLSRRKMEKTLAMGENADRNSQFERMTK